MDIVLGYRQGMEWHTTRHLPELHTTPNHSSGEERAVGIEPYRAGVRAVAARGRAGHVDALVGVCWYSSSESCDGGCADGTTVTGCGTTVCTVRGTTFGSSSPYARVRISNPKDRRVQRVPRYTLLQQSSIFQDTSQHKRGW